MANAPIILDTCALLWLAAGGGQLSEAALARIDAAVVVHVSAISGFEIGLKFRGGKLSLPATPQEWFQAVLEQHSIEVLHLDLSICILSSQLPPIHRDPCDRLIIATAKIRKMPIVTTDALFENYGITLIC